MDSLLLYACHTVLTGTYNHKIKSLPNGKKHMPWHTGKFECNEFSWPTLDLTYSCVKCPLNGGK